MSMAEAAFTPAMMAGFNMELATFQPGKRRLTAARSDRRGLSAESFWLPAEV